MHAQLITGCKTLGCEIDSVKVIKGNGLFAKMVHLGHLVITEDSPLPVIWEMSIEKVRYGKGLLGACQTCHVYVCTLHLSDARHTGWGQSVCVSVCFAR